MNDPDRLVQLEHVPDIPYGHPTTNGAVHPPPAPAAASWDPVNLLDLAAQPQQPPTIGGLVYPAKRTVLSGETESMKTWLALILCKAELDIGIPAVWVDLDAMGPAAILERLQLLGVTDDQIPWFLYIEPETALQPDTLNDLCAHIANAGARLAIIDAFNPILSMHNYDPNSTPDVESFYRTIADPISQAGAAPVLLDHVVKNVDSRGKYSYGSERKASGATLHLGFKILEPLRKGNAGATLITVHKDRPGFHPRPTLGKLILDATGTTIEYHLEIDKSHSTEGEFRPTVLMERISRWLEQRPAAATSNTIRDEVQGNSQALRKAAQILAHEGFINTQEGDRGATLYSHNRAYREALDATGSTGSSPGPDRVPDPVVYLASTGSSEPPLLRRGSGGPGRGVDLEAQNPDENSDDRVLLLEYPTPPADAELLW